MPTFHDATADAAEAYEAVRALAHATRRFDRTNDGFRAEHPEDAYAVMGNVLGVLRSLAQVVEQIGAVHERHAQAARVDDVSAEGRAQVRTVLHHVHDTAQYLSHAHDTFSTGFSAAGRIAWHVPDDAPETASTDRTPVQQAVPRPGPRPTGQRHPVAEEPTGPAL